jgi:hypothetical protein
MSEVTVPQAMAQARIVMEAQYGMLRKVLDSQAASASQILESLPQTSPAVGTGSAVGNNVDFYA